MPTVRKDITALHVAIAATAPILGVAVPTWGDSSSVRIDFDPAATPAQQSAAQAALNAFVWSDATIQAYKDSLSPDLATLRDQAQNASDNNAAYLAITSPTQAQAVAQVKVLTQQMQQVIKALKLLAVRSLS
jgi:xanthine dehydrogenase iron-sulfur cluster and FAD-binding subunit A